jgi:hypothetical protein
MGKFTKEITVGPDDPTTACELLASHTGLPKGRIKDAMTKGAVWLKKSRESSIGCAGPRRLCGRETC